MADPTDLQKDLLQLAADIKRLEAEYNMFFGGRLKRPPWETRSRVEALIKKLDRTQINNYGDRFRFTTLQSRFSTFVELWERGLRAREEGRPGPFAQPRPVESRAEPAEEEQVLHVTTLRDPMREMDKLHALYDQLVEAKKGTGKGAIPFHQFAELVKKQVSSIKGKGGEEVALRVAMKSGKLALTAKPLKTKSGK